MGKYIRNAVIGAITVPLVLWLLLRWLSPDILTSRWYAPISYEGLLFAAILGGVLGIVIQIARRK